MTREDVARAFWAKFLDVKVSRASQVPGFSDWWDRASAWSRQQGERYAESCWLRISCDGREPDDCVAAAVAMFRERLRQAPATPSRSVREYAWFRIGLIEQVRAEGLDPKQVAQALWDHRHEHMDGGEVVQLAEVAAYEAGGHDWRRVRVSGMRTYPIPEAETVLVEPLLIESPQAALQLPPADERFFEPALTPSRHRQEEAPAARGATIAPTPDPRAKPGPIRPHIRG
jgi:hypothetical protein